MPQVHTPDAYRAVKMSDGGEDSSTGETALVYLEKIQPKDLVMFSNATKKIIAKVNPLVYFSLPVGII